MQGKGEAANARADSARIDSHGGGANREEEGTGSARPRPNARGAATDLALNVNGALALLNEVFHELDLRVHGGAVQRRPTQL